MPQQTSTFESHFLTHMQGVAGAYHKLIACSWVPILQVGGLGKVRVNCFPKAIYYNMAWLGIEPATTRSRVRRGGSIYKIYIYIYFVHISYLSLFNFYFYIDHTIIFRTETDIVYTDKTKMQQFWFLINNLYEIPKDF